jgi:O-methyltransferase
MTIIQKIAQLKSEYLQRNQYYLIQKKYKDFSMIPKDIYIKNLSLCNKFKNIEGCVVECGVWRGGMIAGIANLIEDKKNYFLFDSFEGLPQVKEIDGPAANTWQNNKKSPAYFDNCSAEMGFAEKAMQLSSVKKYTLIKGWFSQVLPTFEPGEKIAILRLDGDWYESTMDCLTNLYPKVNAGGIIIIDDYYVWDGCSRAVHDYLSKNDIPVKIHEYCEKVCYIIKK